MFDFEFTLEKLEQIFPGLAGADKWHFALCEELPKYNIDTVNRVAAFLSQCGHESANFSQLHENLNYRAESLMRVWPARFNQSNAELYAHNPEKIANKVYADRMGNGSEASGDGYKYRGRGIIQLTGKGNYALCSKALFNDDSLVNNPDLVESNPTITIRVACWFWDSKNLNTMVDNDNYKEVTHRINGGYNGQDDRQARFDAAKIILQG